MPASIALPLSRRRRMRPPTRYEITAAVYLASCVVMTIAALYRYAVDGSPWLIFLLVFLSLDIRASMRTVVHYLRTRFDDDARPLLSDRHSLRRMRIESFFNVGWSIWVFIVT